ncbi:hypothetical protein ACFWPU_00695 [Streptomyces sp. NPDC058471]|uniref:DUF6197 family protein n=1 Tax=Streptomyces sp. NPDC058471 TaxID=3346516 RepID=UPI00364ED0CD
MSIISRADVYRKAAEVIVRDGKCEGQLVEDTPNHAFVPTEHRIMDTSLKVCALGACVRAYYELRGAEPLSAGQVADLAYTHDTGYVFYPGGRAIDTINDDRGNPTSAEDIALLLKHQAEVEESL